MAVSDGEVTTVNFYFSFLLQKVKLKTREQFVIYKDVVERDF